MFFKVLSVLTLSVVLAACGQQGDERLKEKAEIEGQASAKKQQEVENENLRRKAQEMEKDLFLREKFFLALEGTFEGKFMTTVGEFQARIKFIPSLPLIKTDRTRTLEEIAFDLNNLHFNVQIVEWATNNNMSAAGCVFSNLRPDILSGQLNAASENCTNVYNVSVFETNDVAQRVLKKTEDSGSRSSEYSAKILSSEGTIVENIVIRRQGSNNSKEYSFSAKRVSP